MSALDLIVDTILPGDSTLGMPAASQVDVEGALHRAGAHGLVADVLSVLAEVSQRKFNTAFTGLDASNRLAALNACKVANVRLFAAFLTHVFRAYYSDPKVLRLISAGSSPPFPAGNELGSDDWSILKPVFERGVIYRETDT